jgi:hypothetical protein
MIKKMIFVLAALLSGFIFSGCPAEADSRSTKAVTITGIPDAVTYIIAEASGVQGAAVQGGNLNANPNGKKIDWTPIQNGSATMELYSGPELTAYVAAARKGDALPPPPPKKEVRGSGPIVVMYADNATKGDPSRKKIWGSNNGNRIKFTGDLALKWADGREVNP